MARQPRTTLNLQHREGRAWGVITLQALYGTSTGGKRRTARQTLLLIGKLPALSAIAQPSPADRKQQSHPREFQVGNNVPTQGEAEAGSMCVCVLETAGRLMAL